MTHEGLFYSQLSWNGPTIKVKDACVQLHGDTLSFQQAVYDLNPEICPSLNGLGLSSHHPHHTLVVDTPTLIFLHQMWTFAQPLANMLRCHKTTVPFLRYCHSIWPVPCNVLVQLFEYMVVFIDVKKNEQKQEDKSAAISNK